MININIITGYPNLFNNLTDNFIIKRSIKLKYIRINICNLNNFISKNKKIDGKPYGIGNGMIIKINSIKKCISYIYEKYGNNNKKYILSPNGNIINQNYIKNNILKNKGIILLCGHYKGIDERIKYLFDNSISIGNYIISNGELAAVVIIDSLCRLFPGVIYSSNNINNKYSNKKNLSRDIIYPVYSKPYIYNFWKVPTILLSGNHKKINKWILNKVKC